MTILLLPCLSRWVVLLLWCRCLFATTTRRTTTTVVMAWQPPCRNSYNTRTSHTAWLSSFAGTSMQRPTRKASTTTTTTTSRTTSRTTTTSQCLRGRLDGSDDSHQPTEAKAAATMRIKPVLVTRTQTSAAKTTTTTSATSATFTGVTTSRRAFGAQIFMANTVLFGLPWPVTGAHAEEGGQQGDKDTVNENATSTLSTPSPSLSTTKKEEALSVPHPDEATSESKMSASTTEPSPALEETTKSNDAKTQPPSAAETDETAKIAQPATATSPILDTHSQPVAITEDSKRNDVPNDSKQPETENSQQQQRHEQATPEYKEQVKEIITELEQEEKDQAKADRETEDLLQRLQAETKNKNDEANSDVSKALTTTTQQQQQTPSQRTTSSNEETKQLIGQLEKDEERVEREEEELIAKLEQLKQAAEKVQQAASTNKSSTLSPNTKTAAAPAAQPPPPISAAAETNDFLSQLRKRLQADKDYVSMLEYQKSKYGSEQEDFFRKLRQVPRGNNGNDDPLEATEEFFNKLKERVEANQEFKTLEDEFLKLLKSSF